MPKPSPFNRAYNRAERAKQQRVAMLRSALAIVRAEVDAGTTACVTFSDAEGARHEVYRQVLTPKQAAHLRRAYGHLLEALA